MYSQATNKSTFKQNQACIGVYCGKHFAGKIGPNTRPTPDGQHIIFQVILDASITVFGTERLRIELETNGTDVLYLEG